MELQSLVHEIDLDELVTGTPRVVDSKYGPITVTVCGDPRNTPLITFGEVGANHRTAFRSLVVASSSQSLLIKNFCFYNIDAPGSQPGAEQVDPRIRPFTLYKLADMVEAVMTQLDLREVVGLSAGIGCAVLAIFAAAHPERMAGLILVNPACRKPEWTEWTFGKAALLRMRLSGFHSGVTAHLAKRLLSERAIGLLSGRSDLAEALKRDIRSTMVVGSMEYLGAAVNRPDLTDTYRRVKCAKFIVASYGCLYERDAHHLNASLDKADTSLLELERGGVLVTAETPEALLQPIQSFLQRLQSQGYGQDWHLG